MIIKIHQKTISPKTRRDVYQERRHPTEEMVMPQNISIRKSPRLDLSCFAGDVIIIDHATTTIQVVFRTKVPVIYIDLPSSPLREDVANSMREAMFLVDANVTGWQGELAKLLTMAKHDMQYAWDKKADARRCWVEDYLAGTNNSENFTLDL